jgi:transposase
LSISLGAISSIERRITSALDTPEKEIEQVVQTAEVKYADATPWLQAGALRSLWVVTCNIATLFQIFENGRRKTICPLFGECKGILVSDRASVFTFWKMSLRQICWAHLLRLFVAFSEKGGAIGCFGKELLALASLVFDYWKGLASKAISMSEYKLWMSKVMPEFEGVLARAVASGLPHLAGSCQNLLNHRLALWTFVHVDGVEPTNNNAERSLRRFVLWRKNCFGAFSARGQVFASRIMSVVTTLRQRSVRSLDFLSQCERARQQRYSAPTLFASIN